MHLGSSLFAELSCCYNMPNALVKSCLDVFIARLQTVAGTCAASAAQLNIGLELPAEADCSFPREDIVSKSVVALGQGSSAIVFEAMARQTDGRVLPVVIKERRPRTDYDEDLQVS